ncbi:DUF4922 domain-containing protein, partial [Balneolaceae bacterium ANBcel3]|nr:DUF4922 domain-containing protein [Balneolaceae bacterium ANBcel3]
VHLPDASELERLSPGSLDEVVRVLLMHQYENWPMLREGIQQLDRVSSRWFKELSFSFRLQHNPGRMKSTTADVSKKGMASRTCFLCPRSLPPEQKGLHAGDFILLANPFPIFRNHLTIAHIEHRPQQMAPSLEAGLYLARALGERYALFYNGPECGASAPDHMHFQAGESTFLPINSERSALKAAFGQRLFHGDGLDIWSVAEGFRTMVWVEGHDGERILKALSRIDKAYRNVSGVAWESGKEPMLNLMIRHGTTGWEVSLFLRKKHRPERYFSEGEEKVLFSPGAVDMAGTCILPRAEDYQRLTSKELKAFFQEVSLPETEFRLLSESIKTEVSCGQFL